LAARSLTLMSSSSLSARRHVAATASPTFVHLRCGPRRRQSDQWFHGDRDQVDSAGRTGDELERIIAEARPDAEFAVVSNPEFLREGAAIDDFKRPDRIVIGTSNARAREVMSEVYRPLNLNQPPLFFVDRRTSELIKYAANSFLATKVTFINEVADLCEQVGANIQDVARGMGLDNRIGTKFLHAGPGFGGSCFRRIRWRW